MNPVFRSAAGWILVLSAFVVIAYFYVSFQTPSGVVPYSEFLDRVGRGDVAGVIIRGSEIEGTWEQGRGAPPVFKTTSPTDDGLVDRLLAAGVTVEARKERGALLGQVLIILPFVILIGLWFMFMRQMQGAGNKAMSFGKSRARLLSSHQKKVTFADVAGCDEAKEELREIIEFLKDPQKFARIGGKIPKGVLLIGSPGTGKTLLARAVAGEANVPFFSLSGSDFVEMFVGVGASRVRDLFEQGKKNAPCIVFIDEIDAVGRHRGAGLGGGHDEREQTLNALLVEMDGFEANEGVTIIAATNRPDVLDPALLRPGRFDRRVTVALPDVRGREAILVVHAAKVPLGPDVDLRIIARSTPGFSGADLSNLVNEAVLAAARVNKKAVAHSDLDTARDKVVMGMARRSLVLTDQEKRVTAYHEAGHALTAALTPGAMPVHKVTIIPHAMALGVTQFLPEDDRHTHTIGELKAHIAVGMGGRAAEQLVFGHLTTGAADDIRHATRVARRMVTQWGMSEKIGPLGFDEQSEQVFLGRDIGRGADYSESTAREIDAEVKRFVEEGWTAALTLLREHRDSLERIATSLLERETLTAVDFKVILGGGELGPLPPPPEAPGAAAPRAAAEEASSAAAPGFGVPIQRPATRAMSDGSALTSAHPRWPATIRNRGGSWSGGPRREA